MTAMPYPFFRETIMEEPSGDELNGNGGTSALMLRRRTAEMLGLPVAFCPHRRCARDASCRFLYEDGNMPDCLTFLDDDQMDLFCDLLRHVAETCCAVLKDEPLAPPGDPDECELQAAALEIVLVLLNAFPQERPRTRHWLRRHKAATGG